MHTVGSCVERSSFHHHILLRIDANSMVDRLMDSFNPNWFFYCFAGPFISRFAIYKAFFDSATKHEDGASICKVPVHAIVLDIIDNIRLINLMQHFCTRPTSHHHITAELTAQYYQGAVQVARTL